MVASRLPAYPHRGRLETALDLLFPPKCVGCGRVGRWICLECWPRVQWLGDNQDDSVGPASPLARIVAIAMFEGTAREAVHALKFEGHYAIAPFMGRLMAQRAESLHADLVIPIPLHRSRRRERGYDQAALLAQHLASTLEVPARSDLVRRTRKTKQQTTLDRDSRQDNVRGAFTCPSSLSGESILLVDDVYTTGATMNEVARVLTEAGAGEITGLVFARRD